MAAAINRPVAIRRDTAANWTAKNPSLLDGQEGYETDTRKRKVGAKDANGVLIPWNSLQYDVAAGTGAVSSVAGRIGAIVLAVADITDFDPEVQARIDVLAGAIAQDIEQASKGDITYEYNGATTGSRFTLADNNFDNGLGGRFYKGGPAGSVTSQPGHVPRKGDWHLAVPLTAPAKVAGVTSTSTATAVALSWTAPFDGGSPITDYVVEFRTGTAAFAVFADGVSANTTATVTGLVASTSYEFRISAKNATGTGPVSDVHVKATTA